MESVFSHLTKSGKLRMVDVSAKKVTRRSATARCVVRTDADLASLVAPIGVDVVVASELAGIHAAKNTAELIPLCHPLSLNDVDIVVTPHDGHVEVSATVVAHYRTGVEMEALTACSFAALNLVCSLRHVDPLARIDDLCVMSKTGGKSGPWGRAVAPGDPR